MRVLRVAAFAAVLLPAAAFAQEARTPELIPVQQVTAPERSFRSPVLSIDQQRLFEDSSFGKSSLAQLERASRDLQAEIRKIESDLEIEERLLTERRGTMPPAEFLPLAAAFDEKVEKIRDAWGAKDRELKRQREQDQQRFYETAVPVLAALMQEFEAVILVDKANVILSLDRVDITQVAIERIDARLTEAPAIAPITPPANP